MKRFGFLISKYLAQAVLPYVVLSWLLLSVILFVQQGSRYSEIFFNVNIPKNLIWQLTLALIPNVIAFTCPMAVLIGVIIGLSRMQGDSELTAIRTAGVGNFQIALPILFVGIVLSFFTFLINANGVPFAAKIVRKVALQTALYKLESPLEPGVFNTEIGGYTIYVKDGDIEKGTWKNIFIYYEDQPKKTMRLITSTDGRIDSKDGSSELVLENALMNTISGDENQNKLISEKIGQLRLTIKTKRAEAVEKISGSEATPEELGLNELSKFAEGKSGKEKTEAEIIRQRRIILSITPLLFVLLGVSLVIRFNRAGRGFGIFLALASLLAHYLLTLMGEQLARTGKISVLTGGLIPVCATILFTAWFFLSKKIFSRRIFKRGNGEKKINYSSRLPENKIFKNNFIFGLKTGILDFDIIRNLAKYFFLTFCFLTVIYLIFTAFELWKFAGEINGGFLLLLRYLFYLLPFIYIQLSPSALMIAVLATFVIKSRQNEIVTWTAAGQSIYRLLLPCFVLMIFVGIFNRQFQERVLPSANQTQDELRAQIRSRGVLAKKEGKYWLADEMRIFSFEFDGNDGEAGGKVKNLSVYEFSDDGAKLQAIYKTPAAIWEKDKISFSENAEKTVWLNDKVETVKIPNLEMSQQLNPFLNYYQKPSHLNTDETQRLIETSESESERRNLEVALQKKYAAPFLPFIITLFTAPFALSLTRKGRIVTIAYAVGIWLLFIGTTSVFEQFGLNDFISPTLAVWSPAVFFSIVGIYLLSKVRT